MEQSRQRTTDSWYGGEDFRIRRHCDVDEEGHVQTEESQAQADEELAMKVLSEFSVVVIVEKELHNISTNTVSYICLYQHYVYTASSLVAKVGDHCYDEGNH